MILKGKIRLLSGYSGSSKFNFWKDIRKNDILEVSLVVKTIDRNRNSLYATMVKIYNESLDSSFRCSMTQLNNYLNTLKYEEI